MPRTISNAARFERYINKHGRNHITINSEASVPLSNHRRPRKRRRRNGTAPVTPVAPLVAATPAAPVTPPSAAPPTAALAATPTTVVSAAPVTPPPAAPPTATVPSSATGPPVASLSTPVSQTKNRRLRRRRRESMATGEAFTTASPSTAAPLLTRSPGQATPPTAPFPAVTLDMGSSAPAAVTGTQSPVAVVEAVPAVAALAAVAAAPVTAVPVETVSTAAWRSSSADERRRHALPDDVIPVDRIVDYKDTRGGRYVKVLYSKSASSVTSRTEWIRESDIVDLDVFTRDIDTITAWKQSDECSLASYLASREGKARMTRYRSMGADNGPMACGYEAVGIALQLLGVPNPVTEASIEAFRSRGKLRRPCDYVGVRWTALVKFIELLRTINMDTIRPNLFHGNGVGVDALEVLNLPPGVYLIGGYSKEAIGHAVVANVFKHSVTIQDQDGVHDVSWLREWLTNISYVRRVVLA